MGKVLQMKHMWVRCMLLSDLAGTTYTAGRRRGEGEGEGHAQACTSLGKTQLSIHWEQFPKLVDVDDLQACMHVMGLRQRQQGQNKKWCPTLMALSLISGTGSWFGLSLYMEHSLFKICVKVSSTRVFPSDARWIVSQAQLTTTVAPHKVQVKTNTATRLCSYTEQVRLSHSHGYR